jgi:hypothetical protein
MSNKFVMLAAAGLLVGSSMVTVARTTTPSSSPGATKYAPGQLQKRPGQAKQFAPGQRQTHPGQAKQFAPGQKMQHGTVGRGH